MATSRLDAVYRSLLITKFFTKGWGKPENLRRLFEFRKTVSNRDECFNLIDRDYPVTITKEETSGDCRLLEGHFMTPLEQFLPGIVPPVAQKAHFQALIPLRWPHSDFRPMCIHLAGTGDHYFWRRRQLMAKPLLKEANIGAIILENPFYGLRKPPDQVRSSLHNVSDIFVMGGCLILESMVLMHWCERNQLGPLGVTGLSMGGHMASLAATNWPKPLVLVPCLSWSTASAVFLQGVMSQSINWDLLEDQYLSDGAYREKLSKMVTVVDAAFLAGKKFAQKVSETVDTTIQPQDAIEIKKQDDREVKLNKEIEDVIKEAKSETSEIQSNVINCNAEEAGLNTHEIRVDSNKVKLYSDADYSVKQIEMNDAFKETELKQKENHKKDLEKFISELERLSRENVISKSLYNKLSSNERFELDSKDVEEINKLNSDIMPHIDSSKKDAIMQLHSIENLLSIKPRKAKKMQDDNSASNQKEKKENLDIVKDKKQMAAKSRNMSELTADIFSGLPFVKTVNKKIDISKIHWRDREALQFMRGVMDEFTHLSNFSIPFDTSLIIAVCAKHDAYVPREDVGALEEIWPGAEVRYVDAGHVSAYLLHQGMFRSCIVEAFERSRKKWRDGHHVAE